MKNFITEGKMKEEKLNKFSTNLFGDMDTLAMDMERHAAFIVSSILNYGYSTNYVPYFME